MKESVTAIFDIGKTNKKFFLFNHQYDIVYEKETKIDQIKDDDGYPCDDLAAIVGWAKNTLRDALHMNQYSIEAVNFSAYGATLVHIDSNGEAATPLYNYLKPYPEELLNTFYDKYGGKKQFSVETASPPMGMLNSGLQLYWLKKRKPKLFNKIDKTLHFPQFFNYIFSGEFNTELTSIGCHTGMWHFENQEYHKWIEEENINSLDIEIKPVSEQNRSVFASKEINVGIGIHDSSASLAPFLLSLKDPFVLLSTGTWSIALNPFSRDPLTYDELKRDCLCFMNISGDKVKAARLFLGNEYDYQKEKIEKSFDIQNTNNIKADSSLLQKLINEHSQSKKLRLETVENSGPYPGNSEEPWNPAIFETDKEAYHQLLLDLVSIQADSLNLAIGSAPISQIVVTGGFSKNPLFLKLLATFFPDKDIFSASLSQSSALGACMVTNYDNPNYNFDLEKMSDMQRIAPFSKLDLSEYKWANIDKIK